MDERASIELHLSSKQKGEKNKKGNSFYLSIHEGGKISLVEIRGRENGRGRGVRVSRESGINERNRVYFFAR